MERKSEKQKRKVGRRWREMNEESRTWRNGRGKVTWPHHRSTRY